MFKKLFLLLIFVSLICCGCGKKEAESVDLLTQIIKRDKLIVGVKTDSYPFGFYDEKGNFAGYDIELAKLIASNILNSEKKVKYIPVTTFDRTMKLYSGDVDMIIATMSITPPREELFDFSNSYYLAGQALLVRKDSNITSLSNLNNKKAIIIFGSTSERSLRTAVPNVQIMGYKTYSEGLIALKQGKADAMVSDDTILLGLSLKDNSVKLLPKRYSKEPYAIAFRKGEESKELIKEVNQVIEVNTRNGNLKKLQKSFGIN